MFTIRLFDNKGICVDLWQEHTTEECIMRMAEYAKSHGLYSFSTAECEDEKHIVQWEFNLGERSY